MVLTTEHAVQRTFFEGTPVNVNRPLWIMESSSSHIALMEDTTYYPQMTPLCSPHPSAVVFIIISALCGIIPYIAFNRMLSKVFHPSVWVLHRVFFFCPLSFGDAYTVNERQRIEAVSSVAVWKEGKPQSLQECCPASLLGHAQSHSSLVEQYRNCTGPTCPAAVAFPCTAKTATTCGLKTTLWLLNS